jgi:hypothetical protein
MLPSPHIHVHHRTTSQIYRSHPPFDRPSTRTLVNRGKTDNSADYAEMITQFGYITIWSLVWPLAPIFALINNYVELRADAVKICKHVRRPVGDRVESIGSWLETLVCPLPRFIIPLLCPLPLAPPLRLHFRLPFCYFASPT